jgi:hypothetical protein
MGKYGIMRDLPPIGGEASDFPRHLALFPVKTEACFNWPIWASCAGSCNCGFTNPRLFRERTVRHLQGEEATSRQAEAVARIGEPTITKLLWSQRILQQVVALPFALATTQV